jgi:hypothetical protein
MIDVALSILALIAGGVTMELFAAALPPLGFQDKASPGLQAQASEAPEAFQAGNPS